MSTRHHFIHARFFNSYTCTCSGANIASHIAYSATRLWIFELCTLAPIRSCVHALNSIFVRSAIDCLHEFVCRSVNWYHMEILWLTLCQRETRKTRLSIIGQPDGKTPIRANNSWCNRFYMESRPSRWMGLMPFSESITHRRFACKASQIGRHCIWRFDMLINESTKTQPTMDGAAAAATQIC